jgi:hypothetical protein
MSSISTPTKNYQGIIEEYEFESHRQKVQGVIF